MRQRAPAPTEPPPKTTFDRKMLRNGGWPTVKPKQPSTIDFDLVLPSAEAGPKRNDTYDPTVGFEPYWDRGGWVFDKDDRAKDKTKYMCGVKCPQIYSEYGKICARNKKFKYQTFENYCQLKNKDCSDIDRWMVLYAGKCYGDLRIYGRKYPVSKAKKEIQKFMKLYPKHEKYVGLSENYKGR